MSRARTARARPAGDRRAVALRLGALSGASACVVALVYLLSVQTARGQRVENILLGTRRNQLRGGPTSATELLATVSVWSLVAAIGAVMLIALLRGRPRLALGAGAVIGVSILTTEVLKKLVLPRPRLDPRAPPWLWDNIFPSGHTTIAVGAAVAFVLVVPTRYRGLAALLGGFYAAGVGAATLESGWHRPSDAIGATFLVLAVALGACGALVWWRGAGRPEPGGQQLWVALALAGIAAVAGIVDLVGLPRVFAVLEEGRFDDANVRDGYALSLGLIALSVAVAMGVLLLALHDVSLDSPRRTAGADATPGGTAGGTAGADATPGGTAGTGGARADHPEPSAGPGARTAVD